LRWVVNSAREPFQNVQHRIALRDIALLLCEEGFLESRTLNGKDNFSIKLQFPLGDGEASMSGPSSSQHAAAALPPSLPIQPNLPPSSPWFSTAATSSPDTSAPLTFEPGKNSAGHFLFPKLKAQREKRVNPKKKKKKMLNPSPSFFRQF
jgi:hypothetical protein